MPITLKGSVRPTRSLRRQDVPGRNLPAGSESGTTMTGTYDIWLVLLSYIVAAFASTWR